MSENWNGRLVRDKRNGAVGKVTADLPDEPDDVLAVYFGPGRFNAYKPCQWSKEHLFELVPDEPEPAA